MNRFDEKIYRTQKQGNPTLAEQKSQLSRLKQDLVQFKAKQGGSAVTASLEARIRELEGSIAHAEASKGARPRAGGEGADDAGVGSNRDVRSTSGRFPPRGTPGRTY